MKIIRKIENIIDKQIEANEIFTFDKARYETGLSSIKAEIRKLFYSGGKQHENKKEN